MKNKSIIIICGDPESTFNEILIKTLKNQVSNNIKFPIVLICSQNLFQNEIQKFKKKITLRKFENQKKLDKKNVYII